MGKEEGDRTWGVKALRDVRQPQPGRRPQQLDELEARRRFGEIDADPCQHGSGAFTAATVCGTAKQGAARAGNATPLLAAAARSFSGPQVDFRNRPFIRGQAQYRVPYKSCFEVRTHQVRTGCMIRAPQKRGTFSSGVRKTTCPNPGAPGPNRVTVAANFSNSSWIVGESGQGCCLRSVNSRSSAHRTCSCTAMQGSESLFPEAHFPSRKQGA